MPMNINSLVLEATNEIVCLMQADRTYDAIVRYDELMRSVADNDLGAAETLAIDLEFLVHGHPGSSMYEIENDMATLARGTAS